eukprot:142531_1
MLQRCNSLLKHRQYLFQKALFSSAKKPNCAVILSGCGVYDGTEIQESVAILFSLTKRSNVQCFAPNINQMHVVNHTDGSEMTETRNVLIESARICRGNIKDIKELKADDYNCLLVPGGFGAAKNLCTFAVDGVNMSVNNEVERVVKDFKNKAKPMGFCCISPVIPANIFGKDSVEVTVGNDKDNDNGDWPYCDTAAAIEEMGAKHNVRGPEQVYIDEKNKIVTAAAYMYNGEPGEIFASVNAMCDAVLKLVSYNDL